MWFVFFLLFFSRLFASEADAESAPKFVYSNFQKLMTSSGLKTGDESLFHKLTVLWKEQKPFKEEYEKIILEISSIGGICKQNSLDEKENWISWRRSEKKCGDLTVDGYRRRIIELFSKAVSRVLLKTKSIASLEALCQSTQINPFENCSMLDADVYKEPDRYLPWTAIGTSGPESDIDIVANCRTCPNENTTDPKPKKVVEVLAKTLFDALGVAVFGDATGVIFDTESYIDVVDDLKTGYEQALSKKYYRNLELTLGFVQIARQLAHGVHSKEGAEIFSWKDFRKIWNGSSLESVVDDALSFSMATSPKENLKENLEVYLPISNYLAQKYYFSNDREKPFIAGILGSYFPEAYYTKSSLAHVCYSDDRYGQLFLSLIQKELKDKEKISSKRIAEIKSSEDFIKLTPFVYLVSAIENIGYFFHKLDKGSDFYSSLKNSAKYFFRVSRALGGYWEVDLDSKETYKDPHRKYVYDLLKISSKLERIKRGFLPFTSQKDVEKTFKRAYKAFHGPNPSGDNLAFIKTLSGKLYDLYIKQWARQDKKFGKLKTTLAAVFPKKEYEAYHVVLSESGNYFDTKSTTSDSEKKQAASLEVASMLNLIAGVNSPPNLSKQKEIDDQRLKKKGLLPYWTKEKATTKKLSALTHGRDDIRLFLFGLVRFLKLTLEDYEAKELALKTKDEKKSFKSIDLNGKFQSLLKEMEVLSAESKKEKKEEDE